MSSEQIFRYIHFSGLLLLAGTLISEWILLGPSASRRELNRLARIDLAYGLASIVAVAGGLTLWLGEVGKPSAFYSNNPIFITKVVMVIIVGLLSLPPTVFFIRHRKGEPEEIIPIPTFVRWCVHLEVAFLLIVPLLAVLMARGTGY